MLPIPENNFMNSFFYPDFPAVNDDSCFSHMTIYAHPACNPSATTLIYSLMKGIFHAIFSLQSTFCENMALLEVKYTQAREFEATQISNTLHCSNSSFQGVSGLFRFFPPPPSGLFPPPPVEAVAAATSVHVFIH